MKKVLCVVAGITLAGCAATPLNSGAERVDVVTGSKDVKKCTYLADVVGSQGNRFTGPFTPTANLLLGARQALKNETLKLGGNKVLLQQQQYSQRELFGGTIDAVLVGKAYKCQD